MNTPAYAETTMHSVAQATAPSAASPSAAATRPDLLFVLNNLGFGGSERKIVRLANRLKEEGVHAAIACLNGPWTLESGIRCDVPLEKLERKGKFSFGALWRLRRLILRERPATVIAVNLYQAIYVMLACLFLPYRPRTVALVNTSTFKGSSLAKRMYQAVLARLDHTVHGSDAQRSFWFKANCAASARSSVIYNGVDSDHFDATDFLEASKRVRAQLERRAAELEIADRVHFLGAIEDVRPVLAALDIFLLPSKAVESFSNAALEAMAMGRPVILSNIGGAREMIHDGVEGYVVNPSELAARLPAIVSALYADPKKRRLMGVAARNRAVTCFSVPAMVAGYRGLLHGGDLS